MIEPAGADAAIVEQHHLAAIVGLARARRHTFLMNHFVGGLEVIAQERVREKDVDRLSRRVPGPIAAHHELSSHRRLRAIPYFRLQPARASQVITRIDEVNCRTAPDRCLCLAAKERPRRSPFHETAGGYNHYPRSRGPRK